MAFPLGLTEIGFSCLFSNVLFGEDGCRCILCLRYANHELLVVSYPEAL